MKFEFVKIVHPQDLETIRKIADDVWPKTFRKILSPEQISYMMKMMYSPEVMEREFADNYSFAVLKIDGRPAGYISWSPYGKTNKAKLHKVYLLEEFQGKGLGTKMLEYVAEQCRASGASRLKLNVNKYNEKARKAYLRNGYKVVESVKNDIGNGFFMDDFVMEKELKSRNYSETL